MSSSATFWNAFKAKSLSSIPPLHNPMLRVASTLSSISNHAVRVLGSLDIPGRCVQASIGLTLISALKILTGIHPLTSAIVIVYLRIKPNGMLPTTWLAIGLTKTATAFQIMYRGSGTTCFTPNSSYPCQKQLLTVEKEGQSTLPQCGLVVLAFGLDQNASWAERQGPIALTYHPAWEGGSLFPFTPAAFDFDYLYALQAYFGAFRFAKAGFMNISNDLFLHTEERLCPPINTLTEPHLRCLCSGWYPEPNSTSKAVIPTTNTSIITTLSTATKVNWMMSALHSITHESTYVAVLILAGVLILGVLTRCLFLHCHSRSSTQNQQSSTEDQETLIEANTTV